jgi:hypothetical protein
VRFDRVRSKIEERELGVYRCIVRFAVTQTLASPTLEQAKTVLRLGAGASARSAASGLQLQKLPLSPSSSEAV